MHIVFRADGGFNGLGLGHLMRCIAISEALHLRNATVTFVTRDSLASRTLLENRFHTIWLSQDATAQTDLQKTLEQAEKADWVFVDSYTVTIDYLKALQDCVKTAYFDDWANQFRPADLMIGNGYLAAEEFCNKLPAASYLFAGPAYLPMRQEFINLPKSNTSEQITRILITLGGEDRFNYIEKILLAVKNYQTPLHIDILLGSAYSHFDSLQKILSDDRHLYKVHTGLTEVTPLFQSVDIAITAAGTTVWELAACGVPMILIQAADNQMQTIQYFLKHKLALSVLQPTEINSYSLRQAIDSLKTRAIRAALSSRLHSLVDGEGANRISHILTSKIREISFKEASDQPNSSDSRLIWEWRNDPHTRQASRSQELISWEQHQHWYAKGLEDHNRELLIAYDQQVPIGMVRFDRHSSESAEISLNIAPQYRGKGFGKAVLLAACSYGYQHLDLKLITAEVKSDNVASLKVFKEAGFVSVAQTSSWEQFKLVF